MMALYRHRLGVRQDKVILRSVGYPYSEDQAEFSGHPIKYRPILARRGDTVYVAIFRQLWVPRR